MSSRCAGAECGVNAAEGLFHPDDPLANALSSGVIGPVGHPGRDVAGIKPLGDLDAVEHVQTGLFPDLRVGAADRAVLVGLVLKKIGVDRAGANAVLPLELLNRRDVIGARRQVPFDVEGERRVDAGEGVDLRGVGELLFDGRRGRWLQELAEAGPGIGETPGGDLDRELIERFCDPLCMRACRCPSVFPRLQ